MTAKGKQRRHYSRDERERVLSLVRTTGKVYAAARIAGIANTTVLRWVQAQAVDPRKQVALVEPRTDMEPEAREVASDPLISESRSSVLASLVKLDRVRHLYLDRLQDHDVVEKTTARDASAVVQAATSQIQLLTGGPTGRSEVKVRYVERGALREHARKVIVESAT